MNQNLRKITHKTEFCVIGGGLSGICAAVSAARHGMKVVLMHDRAVLGGNASSEVRMWVCGAHGKNNRETGIIEEIALETYYRNPYRIYPIWDSILFELVKKEKNITLLMNCSCNDITMDGTRILKVQGWQGTTQQWHEVEADYFADCSGDSILAPLSGAKFRMGREGRDEFGESIAPETADKKTMGNSCLIQAREMSEKRDFIAPEWVRKFKKEQLPGRHPDMSSAYENYWYMELGGEQDTINDAEEIRDDLIKLAYGMWDYVKNSGNCPGSENWELDFVGFLPGKRESRRYVGDYIMTQHDVEAEGRFDDVIAYGGWTMDDHNPAGINTLEPPTIYHPAPSPFGIPYRCVYSQNIDNLFFAGRNISVTHSAMSATRVMATCATLGQAVGTAAALAGKYQESPRGIYEKHIEELKQTLMDDDCYLPFQKKELSELTKKAHITTDGRDAQSLINGIERPNSESDNMWKGKAGNYILLELPKTEKITELRLVLDSDLNRETTSEDGYLREKISLCNIPKNCKPVRIPQTLAKNIRIEIWENDAWIELPGVQNNHQRLLKLPINRETEKLRLTILETNGGEWAGIHSVDLR